MKKIIALALALVLALSLGSVAFAVEYKPGFTLKLNESLFANAGGESPADVETGTVISKDNFKVEYKFTKGATLVDSVKIVDKEKANPVNMVYVALKENYTITDAKNLEGTITLTAKKDIGTGIDKGDKFVCNINDTYNNAVVPVYGEKKADNASTEVPAIDTVYVCDEDSKGYVDFAYNDFDLVVTLNMKAKEKVFMALDTSDDYTDLVDELEDKYEDATLQVIKFEAAPKFSNEAKFVLSNYYVDSDAVVYAYADGKLTAVEAEYDEDEDTYTWTADEADVFVISDVELVAAAEEETKNPDTGANDVVGVAAALAVVSLVAAGAVALKK